MKFNLLVFAGMAMAGAILSRARNSDKGIKAAETSGSAMPKETRTEAGNSDVGIEAAETDDDALPEEFLEAQKKWESKWMKQQKEVKVFIPPPKEGDLRSLIDYQIAKKMERLAKQTENLVLPDKPDKKALSRYEATTKAREYLKEKGLWNADGPL